jgi:hypothetical protein
VPVPGIRLDPSILRRWRNEQLREVRFARSEWQSGGGKEVGILTDRAPGAVLGGEVGEFEQYGGQGEAGFLVSTAPAPSFEDTFVEL